MNDEATGAAALKVAGFIVDEYPADKDRWFVGLGGHGGTAPTLRKAMKRCLRCCKVWKFWNMPDGRTALDVCCEVAEKHLGGWEWKS